MNENLLIIDDEPNVRLMMQLALQHVGYRVETATDGTDGLAKYGNGAGFDLVIVDHRMPGMTGLEVMQAIFERNDSARVVLATAFGTIDLALEAIQGGAHDFLRKPFTAETLRNTVRTALDRPIEHHRAVPVGLVCKSFTRSTFNGYSFSHQEESIDEVTGAIRLTYSVHQGDSESAVTVVLSPLFMELVKAHTDLEEMPGGIGFWHALAEGFLANHLLTTASLPASGKLLVEELTPGLQNWIDSVLTVDVTTAAP